MAGKHSTIGPINTAEILVLGLRQGTRYMSDLVTVQVTSIVDELTGQTVGGVSLPMTLQYSGSSPANGIYFAKLPATAELMADRWYVATISAVLDDSVLTIKEKFLAQEREA